MNLSELTMRAPRGFKEQTLLDNGLVDGFVSLDSPIGQLNISFNPRGVSSVAPVDASFVIEFKERFHRQVIEVDNLPKHLDSPVHHTLETGQLGNLSLDWRGQTEFQQAVLSAAARIPTGEVRPYVWIATEIGRPQAVRAVGSALGQNPVPVLVACHRVIRADGRLGDYRFGTSMKAALLEAEGLDLKSHGGVLVGNIKSELVCYPSCHEARALSPEEECWFRSPRAARQAGYAPCGRCKPVLGDRP